MKWIGQHIVDLIARFRGDVYLEDIDTGTIASGGNLGLDSDNKIVKQADTGITDLHGAGVDGSANQLLTDDGDGTVTSEANLTFDGSALTVTGDLTVNGDNITFQSANADDPIVTIKNTANDNQAARLVMWKDRGAAMADNDRIAEIEFFGEDASQNLQGYGKIMCQALESDHGVETGTIKIQTAEYDGTLTNGLVIAGGTADGVVDVTLGAGAASTTTVAGTLQVTSSLRLDSATLSAIQTSSEPFADNNTSLMTSAAIDDKIQASVPNLYGSTIKLLPSDFVTNEEGGSTKHGVGYVDNDDATYGMKVPNAGTELFAFVSIPEGMKATHVDIYDNSHNLAVEVFEIDVNSSGLTSKGSGNANTTIDITDVNATATNLLAIEVTTIATSNRVYGGVVTIAAQ
tara:strand:+ start:94 stop:1302 length:1209 start_codon:yes stop_codon:yes gene_type:complete